jgi:hypothetical protein
VAAGCSTTGGSVDASVTTEAAPTPSATADVAVAPTASEATPSSVPAQSPPQAASPPTASLEAEGGDPVAGQLGSYTWAGGGSDSPWLPGSALTVGAGEPLTVRLGRPAVVADWTASRVAAGTTDGSGAVALASAEAEPIRFVAPPAGRCSLQLQVRFDGGADSATYYWLLDVR